MKLCHEHLCDKSQCCPPVGTWRIDIPDIPEGANYHGGPQAVLLKMGTDNIWDAMGHLLLSANPECVNTLKELVEIANRTLTPTPEGG